MNKIVLTAIVCGLLFACQQPTNKKVTIDYEENGKKQDPKETPKSPIVALDMVPNKPLPQTGNYTIYTISIMIGLALAIGVGFKIKSKN